MSKSRATIDARIDGEVQEIVDAAHRIIRYANEIPLVEDGEFSDFDRLSDAEKLLLAILNDPQSIQRMDILTHFRKWSPNDVTL